MSKQTSPFMMVAAFLMGIGLFSFFYPIFIKLFAPARACANYQSYLLVDRSFFFKSINSEPIIDNPFQSGLAVAIRQSNRFQSTEKIQAR